MHDVRTTDRAFLACFGVFLASILVGTGLAIRAIWTERTSEVELDLLGTCLCTTLASLTLMAGVRALRDYLRDHG